MAWHWTRDLRRKDVASHWFIAALTWGFTLAVLIGGWAAVLHQIAHERSEAQNAAVAEVNNRAMALEQYATRTFDAADMVTRHVGEKFVTPELASRRGKRPLEIADHIVGHNMFAAIHVVGLNGDLLATTLKGMPAMNLREHPTFQAQQNVKGERLLVSRPLQSAYMKGTYVHISRAILNPEGRTEAFVGVQVAPSELSNFIKDASFRQTDLISVIGLDGITLARREGNRLSAGEDLRGKLVMKMQDRAPNGTYIGPSSLDGHVRYFSHRRLHNIPVFVTAGISRDEIMAPVDARAAAYKLMMALMSIVALVIASVTMVTYRRTERTAHALREANTRLKTAQRIAKIGDWELDLVSGSVLWSDQLCDMYERSSRCDQLSSEDFLSYLDEDGRKTVRQAVDAAVKTGEPQVYEFRAHLPSGTVSDRLAIAVPSRGQDSQVLALHGTDQDVTKDRLLHTLQEQVAHLGRVDAMNAMASTLAHELNQPLTAAANYLSAGERILKTGTAPTRETMLAEAIQLARHQVHNAGQIIRRVRDMLSAKERETKIASLHQVADDAVSLLSASGQKSCIVRCRIDVGAETVNADPIQVQQVLLNLLRNACEASANQPEPEVLVSAEAGRPGYVDISVTDNGPGIKTPLDEVFSPFSSSKEKGLGLGLSISRTIVEYHGGNIWVAKSDDSGTTVTFALPSAPTAEFGNGERALTHA